MNASSTRNRPSISVSGKTYARLREARPSGSVASLIEGLIVEALDDPAIASRVLAASREAY